MTSVGRETSSQVDQQLGGPFDDTMPSRNCSAARPWCDWCEHTQSQPILISHLGSFPAQTPMPVAFISRLGSALRHVGRQPASSSPATPDSRSHRTPFPQPGLGANPKDINGTTPAASHFANSALRPTPRPGRLESRPILRSRLWQRVALLCQSVWVKFLGSLSPPVQRQSCDRTGVIHDSPRRETL